MSTNTLGLIMQFPLPPSLLPAQVPAALPPMPMLTEPYSFPCLDVALKENGDFESEDIDLSLRENKSEWFQELCKQYQLAHSGSKAACRNWLIKFSLAGMAKWKSSLSNLSRTKFLLVERSKDTHSDAEINGIIPWAESLIAKMAQMPPQPLHHTHLLECRVNSLTSAMGMQIMLSICLASSTIIVPAPSPASGCSSIDIDGLGITAHSTDMISMAICPDSPTLPHPALREEISSSSPLLSQRMSTSVLSSVSLSEVTETASVSSDDVASDSIYCTLKLANRVKITIKQSDVPPTTPFCYADMSDLIASWDDYSPDWALPPNHPIVIHRYPIPVKHFQQLYQHNSKMGDEWKCLKNDWMNWRAYKASTPGTFWTWFSNDQGWRLPFLHITKLLMEE
ncbi:hypothetical protein IW261DRAFT_1597495 [Armillaria novae-zelandiae]|uniref:Uncharacterized protein n=1 Tax=Armillaria novae-zelandiae TaxID=153914 RepID=A0AA39NSI9_9AGAR|nr:hypothetical protein IW261DRAFT_1597495 [Armillaria novae-zelandiae]